MTSAFNGTWLLENWTSLKNGTPDGFPMGQDAKGQIIYAEDGHMCAFLMRADFPSGTDAPSPETCLSYGGTWSFADGKITHQVNFSSLAHWVGRPLMRYVEQNDDHMTLRTKSEFSKSGNRYEHALEWRRVT